MGDLMMLVAYVRHTRLSAVRQALRGLSVSGWTESAVVGHGSAAAGHGVEHVRFELVVAAHRADACRAAIVEAAHTGVDGDGLVVTLPVGAVQRISDQSFGGPALRAAQ